jgi:hypothetical protein
MLKSVALQGMFLALMSVKICLNLCGVLIWGDVNDPDAGVALVHMLAVI